LLHRFSLDSLWPRRAIVTAKGAAVSESFQSIDPLKDPRWDEFVCRHPRASIFHTRPWLEALRRTYGYDAVAFTATPAGSQLRNGVVFSRVTSWLVRPRLVSLPFSDHADPLLDDAADCSSLIQTLQQGQAAGKWKSIELRPPDYPGAISPWDGLFDGQTYFLHRLDLRPTLQDLFRGLHKDSIQRKIRRAERECLVYEEGRSEALLQQFYQLTVLTRRRQALPPPPVAWYRNVLECLGEHVQIRMVKKNHQAIAAILTLHYKQTMVYKYGCSDARFHSLGGMPFVLWKTIEDAKRRGATQLDLGRSDCTNAGLITFKERFGATGSSLIYKKYPNPGHRWSLGWQGKTAKRVFEALPAPLQVLAGRIIYPHIG
jgi:Acetyltransferase (GNAT) domain